MGSFDDLPAGVLDDVAAAFVFPADGAADFARGSGSRRDTPSGPTVVPGRSAGARPRSGSASQLHHSAIEEAVPTSGAGWTILRPGTFANNLLTWAQPIRFEGGVRGPYPTSAQAPIHEADVAAAAAAVLTQPGHRGRTYPMTGPQPDVPRPPDHLTGRQARTLAQWARDHVADFGGAMG